MLSLWRYTFELVSKDLELLKKKKQALDDLLSSKKISQPTYEHINKEISEALADVEKYLESVILKMKNRMADLEKQVSILEIFLANVEILHATGEIDEETYEKQSKALYLGLESMRNEVNEIKSILEKFESKPSEVAECKEECEEEETEEETEESSEEETKEESSEIF